MSLFSRLFYRRPPNGLLEFVERVYVFDSCFSTEVLSDGIYQVYLREIITELHEEFADSSFLAFNFREGGKRSQFANVLCEYDITVIDYPRQYEGCPLLPLSLIQHFLRVTETWLSLENHQNVILVHCERGGWPLLAFVLASLLVFRKLQHGEQRTLEIVHREAPKGFLQLLSPLNPFPSQLRYLQYVARRNISPEWPPTERALSLDCLILRAIPNFDNNGGCRPMVRIFGRNLHDRVGLLTNMLFSMPKKKKSLRQYRQADCDVIKIDIQCLVQGDVVLECLHLDLDSEREIMMFRIMFNTAFIRSNILMLNCEDIDILWDSKERFPKGFRAEILFGESENISPRRAPPATLNGEEKGGLPIEAFSKVQELFDGVEWVDGGDDAALWLLRQISANALQDKFERLILSDAKELLKLQNKVETRKYGTSPIDSEEESDASDILEPLEVANCQHFVHDFHTSEDPSCVSSPGYYEELVLTSTNDAVLSSAFLDQHSINIDHSDIAEHAPSSLLIRGNQPILSPPPPSLPSVSCIAPPPSPSPPPPPPPLPPPPPPPPSSPQLQTSTTDLPPPCPLPPSTAKRDPPPSAATPPFPSHLMPTRSPPPLPLLSNSLAPLPPPPSVTMTSGGGSSPSLQQSSTSVATPGRGHPPPPPPPLPLLKITSSGESTPVSQPSTSVPTSGREHPPALPPLLTRTTGGVSPSPLPQPSTSVATPGRGHLPPPPPPPPFSITTQSGAIPSSVTMSGRGRVPPPPPAPPPPNPNKGPLSPPPLLPVSNCPVIPPPSPPVSDRGLSPSPPPPSPLSFVSNKRPPPPPPPPPFHKGPPSPPSITTSGRGTPSPLSPLLTNRAPPPPPPPPPPPISDRAPPPPPPPVSNRAAPPSPPPPPPLISNRAAPPPPPPPPPISNRAAPPPPPPPLISNRAALPPPPISNRAYPSPPPPPVCKNLGGINDAHGGCGAPHPPPPPPPPPPISLNHNSQFPPQPPSLPVSKGHSPLPPPPPWTSKQPNSVPPPLLLNGEGCGNVPGPPQPPGVKAAGGPVPPPPLYGRGRASSGRGRGAVSTTAPKRASLKPLHWVKVTRAMQGSLWADSQKQENQSSAPEIDISELESLFSVAATSGGSGTDKGGIRRGPNINKPETVHLVDMRRANNCEIMLTKIKMPLPDMMSAILALNTTVLDIDQVENLIKFCPTKEEMEMLKNYTGNRDMLGRCEQFFLELMKVPRVESKLRVFSFRITFSMQVKDLRSNLNIINDASIEVKSSKKLRQIMQTILTLGNVLNQGTARGSAVGFKLDSLLKLSDIRARNNKMTLMHYLCKLIVEKMPELLEFYKDLIHLEAASKIQLKLLAEEMQAVSKGLEKVEQELTASEGDGVISMGFRKALKDFLDTAEADVRSLTALYSEVGRNADSLAQYFGEDPARCPFEQVTSILVVFVNMFNKAREENAKLAEAEKKKLEKEASKDKANSSVRKDL